MTKPQTTSKEAYASLTDTVNALRLLRNEDKLRADLSIVTKSQTTSKEAYASLTDTVNALKLIRNEDKLRVDLSIDEDCGDFALYFKTGDKWHMTGGRVYQCGLGYYCVSVNAALWQAPVVWNGPRASWDDGTNESLLREFVAFVLEALEMS